MTVLLFIATIIIFLTIDYFVRRSKRTATQPVLQRGNSDADSRRNIFLQISYWLSLFPSGKVQLGIDDFLARMFTKPQITMLKRDSESVVKGEPIVRIAEGKNEVVVRSPIDGVIENVNSGLSANPRCWPSVVPARMGVYH